MRILQVNKYHYERGGADKYYLELGKALTASGHELAYFSMQHPRNLETKWSKYFVSRVSFNEFLWRSAYKIPGRIIYSLEAKKKFKQLILDFKPDIIHLHNIYHQISPSILDVAKKFQIPVVMHVHDYNLVCPNHALFVRGKICTECLGGKYYNCIKRKCVKNSYLASILAATELYIHNKVLNIYQKNIKLLITPSNFMKNILLADGWPEDRVKVINNPFKISTSNKMYLKKDYFIYCGRLSEEKGIETIIKAVAKNNKLELKIVGSGPLATNLNGLVKSLNLDKQVVFLGWKTGEELERLIGEAKALLIPSRWFENFPLIALESLALGTPVIASETGGLPEIISANNGALAKIDDANDWLKIMNMVMANTLSWSRNDIINSANKYKPEINLDLIVTSYKQLIKANGK